MLCRRFHSLHQSTAVTGINRRLLLCAFYAWSSIYRESRGGEDDGHLLWTEHSMCVFPWLLLCAGNDELIVFEIFSCCNYFPVGAVVLWRRYDNIRFFPQSAWLCVTVLPYATRGYSYAGCSTAWEGLNEQLTVGTCESAVCVRNSNRIFESNLVISNEYLKKIIIKISICKWSKRDVRNYIFFITILKHIKVPAYDHS